MVVSKTGVVLFMLLFYATVSIFIGLSSDDISTMNYYEAKQTDTLPYTDNALVKSRTGFIGDVVTGYSNLPFWINAIIFTPAGIILGWVLITTFVPTLDGGS